MRVDFPKDKQNSSRFSRKDKQNSSTQMLEIKNKENLNRPLRKDKQFGYILMCACAGNVRRNLCTCLYCDVCARDWAHLKQRALSFDCPFCRNIAYYQSLSFHNDLHVSRNYFQTRWAVYLQLFIVVLLQNEKMRYNKNKNKNFIWL